MRGTMRQLSFNDARTLLTQRTMQRAIRHARALKTGRVRHLQRRYIQKMAARLRAECK